MPEIVDEMIDDILELYKKRAEVSVITQDGEPSEAAINGVIYPIVESDGGVYSQKKSVLLVRRVDALYASSGWQICRRRQAADDSAVGGLSASLIGPSHVQQGHSEDSSSNPEPPAKRLKTQSNNP